MPWWGWIIIIVVAIAIIAPIKVKILNKMFSKKDQENNIEE